MKTDTLIESEDTSSVDCKVDLQYLEEFLSEYIGYIVTGFEVYGDEFAANTEETYCGILSAIDVVPRGLSLDLTSISGDNLGKIYICPTLTGEFLERGSETLPVTSSIYRIYFLGDLCLEYRDSDDKAKFIYKVS